MLESFISLVYPPQCLVCGRRLAETEIYAFPAARNAVCRDCQIPMQPLEFVAPELDSTGFGSRSKLCRRCLTPFETVCFTCLYLPEWLGKVWSLYPMGDQTEALIKSFKYRGSRRLSILLTEAVLESGCLKHFNSDLIVPVPSSSLQLHHRGYSHTALVARELSRKSGLPVELLALRSSRPRQAQAGLAVKLRLDNICDAFQVKDRRFNGRRVLLFDDVLTTGATAFEAARTLISGGAKSVDILTIARSRRFALNLATKHSENLLDCPKA